jgi:hypothetical protein
MINYVTNVVEVCSLLGRNLTTLGQSAVGFVKGGIELWNTETIVTAIRDVSLNAKEFCAISLPIHGMTYVAHLSCCGHCAGDKILEPRFRGRPVRGLLAIPAELSQHPV